MRRAEVVATVLLPLILGALVLVPLPGSSGEPNNAAESPRVFAWSCGGVDAGETPALVVRLPAAEPPNAR